MSARVRVTITLPADLLRRIDRHTLAAAAPSRSSVMERWLREGSRRQAERELEAATVAYYAGLSEDEKAEDLALAGALTTAARHVAVDPPARPSRKRTRK